MSGWIDPQLVGYGPRIDYACYTFWWSLICGSAEVLGWYFNIEMPVLMFVVRFALKVLALAATVVFAVVVVTSLFSIIGRRDTALFCLYLAVALAATTLVEAVCRRFDLHTWGVDRLYAPLFDLALRPAALWITSSFMSALSGFGVLCVIAGVLVFPVLTGRAVYSVYCAFRSVSPLMLVLSCTCV